MSTSTNQNYCSGTLDYCSNNTYTSCSSEYQDNYGDEYFFASGSNDVDYISCLNKELIEKLGQFVFLYIIDENKTVANVWGESKQKFYYDPVKIRARILYENSDQQFGVFGKDMKRKIKCYFHNEMLNTYGLKYRNIQEGDVLKFGEIYYTISFVSDYGKVLFGNPTNPFMTYAEGVETPHSLTGIE